jgi:hypothetical protein
MIRPPGYSFVVEASIRLNKNITLGEITKIIEDIEEIQLSVVKTFKTGNILIVPLLDFV